MKTLMPLFMAIGMWITSASAMTFVHPGALDSGEELDFVKARIQAGVQPWKGEFDRIRSSSHATRSPHGLTNIDSNTSDASVSRDDAIGAYTQALLWYFTDDEAYAGRSIAILNSWTNLQGFTAGSDQDRLQAGWIGAVFAPAAEIMRLYPGWTSGEIADFQAMFQRAFYPKLNTASTWNGNVDLTQIDAMMAIAVFNEDEALFSQGLARWKIRIPAYFYLTSDGPLPKSIAGDGGNLDNFWSHPLKWIDGLTQETCRDNGHHSQFGLGSALHAAEVAWHQGVDVYSENQERFTAAMELMAAHFLTGSMQGVCSNDTPTPDRYDTWEVGYNHYHNRAGAALPNTLRLILEQIRPDAPRAIWNLNHETLTHADLPGILSPLGGVAASGGLAHRQSALTVEVQNLSGAPLEGATVRIEMLDPTFRFGAAISADEINPSSAQYDAKAVVELQRYFNSMTFGNYMKWAPFESRSVGESLAMVDLVYTMEAFNSDNPLRLRGHATIWGADYQVPDDFRAMTDRSGMRARLLNHISAYHTAFRDTGIDNFDLYNEPFHETELIIDKLIDDPESLIQHAAEAATWFMKAKEADPAAVLYINDYNMLNFWKENDEDIVAYKTLIDAIRDAGGPIDGIGLQAHMDRFITQEQFTRRLDLLAAPMAPTTNFPEGLPGLPIEITELDINTQGWTAATPEDQAEVTANVLEAGFAHPAVEGITIWGMNDSSHWRGNAILFDDSDRSNWVSKPSGREWIARVKGTWWTDLSGFTGRSGAYTGSVFKGQHRITVSYNGSSRQFVRDITADDALVVVFDAAPVDTSQSLLLNLSVRTTLVAGQILGLGFVVIDGNKQVLLRAGGPALTDFGLGGMPDPTLSLFRNGSLIASNDDWDAAVADVPVAARVEVVALNQPEGIGASVAPLANALEARSLASCTLGFRDAFPSIFDDHAAGRDCDARIHTVSMNARTPASLRTQVFGFDDAEGLAPTIPLQFFGENYCTNS